jgi:DNA-binding beta-propeller fold protein YncE
MIPPAGRVALIALSLAAVACGSGGRSEPPVPESLHVVGKLGRQAGQFSKPRAVAITRSGLIGVIDRTGRFLLHSASTGEYVRHWWLQDWNNGTPTGLSVDPADDTFWVADTHYARVIQYDQEGKILRQFGELGEAPGKFVFITDVTPDPDGKTLWITDYGRRNRVMKFTREGEFIREWGPELYVNKDLERPMGVEISPDGSALYVVDTGNCRVNVYDREGALLRHIGSAGTAPGQLHMPQDLSVAPDGTLYLVEYAGCRVSRFSASGEFLGTWGRTGSGPGEFYTPWGLAVGPAGELAIADTLNHRIVVVHTDDIPWSQPTAIELAAGTPAVGHYYP